MKPTEIEVQSCIECPLFHYEHSKNFPKIPHCNFYKSLGWKLSFRAEEEKHPLCKVVSIVVNEEE